MSDIIGRVVIEGDSTSLVNAMKTGGDAAEKQAERIKKANEKAQKSLENFQAKSEVIQQREIKIERQRGTTTRSIIRTRSKRDVALEEAKAETKLRVEEARRATILLDAEQKRENALFRKNLRDRALTVEQQVAAADRFRARNPNFANMRGGAGGGGIFGGIGRRLAGMGGGGVAGSLVGGLVGGFGLGLGGYAAANAVRGVTEAVATATAYERQRVASANLAGSQEKLNALMDAYTKASGGAVDKVTTLNNVTRLLATGYAETVPEVERFVRATRGASIALGKPQDYVIQETQLAISNTSIKRLDQIGLGIEEVQTRIKELRATNSDWNREMAFQESVLSLMEQKYGKLTQTVEGQATEVELLAKNWRDLGLAMGQASKGPVNQASGWLNDLMSNVTNTLNQRQAEARQRELAYQLDLTAKLSGADRLGDYSGMAGFMISQGARDTARRAGIRGRPSSVNDSRLPDEEILTVRRNAYDALLDLERRTGQQRLQMVEDYELQRNNLISNFNKQNLREEQDFARQRARALEDYERNVLDIMRDAQERERGWQEDLDERTAEIHADGNERIAEIEEDFQKDREKSEKDHRDRMLKAAGQLDAIAVLEERKRWKKENEEKEEGHKEALEDARDAMQEQIDDAVKAHNKRLEDARDADEKRLRDMAADRERSLARENEDRAIQKERAIEDHNDQLDEMARLHGLRMEQLARESEEEKKAIEERMVADLDALNVYIEGYKTQMLERDKMIDQWFDSVIERLEKEIAEKGNSTYRYDPATGPQIPDSYATGGAVRRTGPAMLHAGEYVLNHDMLASGFSPTVGNNQYNNRSITIQSGAISVQTTPGMEYLVGELLEEQLAEILEKHYA